MASILIESVLFMDLNYKTFGQGEPVIILHGLFGSLDNWHSFAKDLAHDYLVYIVDQRDHGKSPHTTAFDYNILAEDLRQFMEDKWILKAHIMGHSMGGKVAMQFAALYPQMIDKLIILDIAPKKYHSRHDDIFEALLDLNLEPLKSRKEAEDIISVKIKADTMRAFLLKNLKRNKDGSFKWKINLALLFENYDNISEGLEHKDPIYIPSLFVNGSKSDYVNEEDKIFIRKIFPNTTFVTIQGAGHWLHADKPTELKNILVDFIS